MFKKNGLAINRLERKNLLIFMPLICLINCLTKLLRERRDLWELFQILLECCMCSLCVSVCVSARESGQTNAGWIFCDLARDKRQINALFLRV